PAYRSAQLPVFITGFSGKFPDPHNFAFAYLHSNGVLPIAEKFSDPRFDRLIEQANVESDPTVRQGLYEKLQALEFEEVPHVSLADVTRFRVQRDWVHGWVDNPMYPGSPYSTYFYPISKK